MDFLYGPTDLVLREKGMWHRWPLYGRTSAQEQMAACAPNEHRQYELMRQADFARQQASFREKTTSARDAVWDAVWGNPEKPKNLSFKQELQKEVDEWLDGVFK